ncbi:SiaB family protein kinase [Eisenibacter elegans]|uniref:SiaB family protein kinase n=1 Tax=Eisenibacter elegans TaxID=997 RepID=UPI00047DE648|nr:SiaB family protein kinase [Eisenibacter elegans]
MHPFLIYTPEDYSPTDETILLYYHGAFDAASLAAIGEELKQKLQDQPQVSWKIFAIFIELAQNIMRYAEECNICTRQHLDAVGTCMLRQQGDTYRLTMANITNREGCEFVQTRCAEIAQTSPQEWRKMKGRLRKEALAKGWDGAGIGLIQTAIWAENPLELQVYHVNDKVGLMSLVANIKA